MPQRRETTRLLAERGFRLLCADNNSTALRVRCDEVGADLVFCDIESAASMVIFLKLVVDRFGAPDVIVNAAGHTYLRSLDMIRITRAFTPLLKERATSCAVINVASSKEEKVFSFSSSHHGFGSIARSLERNLQGSCITVAACMSSGIADWKRCTRTVWGATFGLRPDLQPILLAMIHRRKCVTQVSQSPISRIPLRKGRAEVSHETRRRLLEAATTIFVEEGQASTLDQITALAGHTKGAVYWHFPDKQSLYPALLTAQHEHLLDMSDRQ